MGLGCAGQNSGTENEIIWLDNVNCEGNEGRLENCNYSTPHNCIPAEAAGVLCGGAIIIIYYTHFVILHKISLQFIWLHWISKTLPFIYM